MSDSSIFWCQNCLNMSTRPRITFDEKGWCNACQWAQEKQESVDWASREIELLQLVEECRTSTSSFDCLVPVSGGKDGSYVAYQLKSRFGLNPLTVTIRPHLEQEIGQINLSNFIESGFSHLHITPEYNAMRALNRLGFIEKGFPYYGWLTAIQAGVLRVAERFSIGLIFYGEDGEVEYGGSTETRNTPLYSSTYMKNIYLEGGHERVLAGCGIKANNLFWFEFPGAKALEEIKIAHWSYFESWDPYRNYLVAKEHCGLQEKTGSNSGTFTNFAQNDQALYALHTYLMYLKFGFGRATQDVGIEIRRGAMTREQGINLVRLYDGAYPLEYLDQYLQYFEMTQEEFDRVIDKWANKDLFEKSKNVWEPTFSIS